MPAFDLEDSDSWRLTDFDRYRLEDAEPGSTINLEMGGKVIVYKNSYILLLENEGQIRKKQELTREFKTVKELIKYLISKK